MGKITDFLLNLQNPLNTHWMMIAIRLCVCVFACVFLTEIIIPSRFQSAIILSFMLLSLSVKSNTSCTDISYFSNSMLPGVLLMCYARFRLHNVSPIIAWCCRCKASGRVGKDNQRLAPQSTVLSHLVHHGGRQPTPDLGHRMTAWQKDKTDGIFFAFRNLFQEETFQTFFVHKCKYDQTKGDKMMLLVLKGGTLKQRKGHHCLSEHHRASLIQTSLTFS